MLSPPVCGSVRRTTVVPRAPAASAVQEAVIEVAVARFGASTTVRATADASTDQVSSAPATGRAAVDTVRTPVEKRLTGRGLESVTEGAEAVKGPRAKAAEASSTEKATVGVGGTAPGSPPIDTPVADPNTASTSAAAADAGARTASARARTGAARHRRPVRRTPAPPSGRDIRPSLPVMAPGSRRRVTAARRRRDGRRPAWRGDPGPPARPRAPGPRRPATTSRRARRPWPRCGRPCW